MHGGQWSAHEAYYCPMRILRLTNSSDLHPGVSPERRSPEVSARWIERATGELVETQVRAIWPTPALPELVERWVVAFEADVVFFRLSSFWVAYESVPLRIERRLKVVGKPLANAGLRLGDRPWLVGRREFKTARRVLTRAIGGDTHFTPGEAADALEGVFRRVLACERALPVVRGTSLILNSAGTSAGLRRSQRRVAELNALVEASCQRLRIPFSPEESGPVVSTTRLVDDLHDSALAHQRLGEAEGRAIAEAWLATRP